MLVNSIKTKNNFHNYIVIKQSDNTSSIELLLCGANGSILSDLNQSCTLTILDEVDQLIRQKTKEQIVNGTITFRVANDLKTNPHTLEITTADGQKFPSNHDFKIFVSYTHDESELRVINNLSREEALAEIDQSVKEFISENTEEYIDKVATSKWLYENNFKPKEPVATFSDLPKTAELKELRGVTDENAVYVFDGVKWIKQSNINYDGLNLVKVSIEDLKTNLTDTERVLRDDIAIVDKKTEIASNTQKSRVIYRTSTSLRVIGTSYQMLGFRFMGQYHKTSAPYYKTLELNNIVTVTSNLGAETSINLNTWYALFACGNPGNEIASFKVMPFLRVASVNGSVITFGESGENSTVSTARTHTFTNDNLVGCDVLIVSEKIDNRNNAYSGRIAKVIANTNGTVTLDNIGTISTGDYLLVAPPGFTDYRYLASFYYDSAEIRNFADSGNVTATRGSAVKGYSINNDISVGIEISLSGHVSPLSTGAMIQIRQTISSSAVGSVNLKIGMDNTHDYSDVFERKTTTSSEALITSNLPIYFGYRGQTFNLKSSGTIHSTAIRQIDVRGYVEL